MLLEVSNLGIAFGKKNDTDCVVDNVSFHIDVGETFCLVGESGSGKSLTALSIPGLLPGTARLAERSSIKFSPRGGQPIDLLSASEKAIRKLRGAEIAMIFQEPMTSLNPVLTIGEQLIEVIELRWPGIKTALVKEKAISILKQVQIEDPIQKLDEYPHRLSGGQRQRVMIAMACVCEPSLLVADEPTTALDVTVQAEVICLLGELQRQNSMSVLFITHDLGVVSQIADRVAVMESGRLVEQGVVRTVLHAPKHPYTKKLIDSLPENLVKPARSQVEASKDPDLDSRDMYLSMHGINVTFLARSGLLRRKSGAIKVLDNAELSIRQGDIVALVGESGSGKTTLGRVMLGLLDVDSGAYFLHGEDLFARKNGFKKELRTKFQCIFQDPASSLNPRLSVVTALTEPMAVHGIGLNYDERVYLAEQLLEDMHLERSSLWRFPHQFSGGQRQRIAIARALSVHPEFVVCDEITSALDVSVQADILQLLLSLRDKRNLTLLFISHDIGVVEFVSDYTAVMHRGQIVEFGKTANVCSNPQKPYTKKLLSAVPGMLAA